MYLLIVNSDMLELILILWRRHLRWIFFDHPQNYIMRRLVLLRVMICLTLRLHLLLLLKLVHLKKLHLVLLLLSLKLVFVVILVSVVTAFLLLQVVNQ